MISSPARRAVPDETTGRQEACFGPTLTGMTGHHSPAHLEWWANPSTCLSHIPVRLEAAADDDAWDAVVSPELDGDAGENLRFLIDADPVFTLRFEDDSVTEVVVEHRGDLPHLRLRAASDPEA